MNTHTVRNKRGATPVFSLTPWFMARVLTSEPDAINLALGWFSRRYKELTGKEPALDYNQKCLLNDYFGVGEDGSWVSSFSRVEGADYRVLTIFEQGFLTTSGMEFEQALEVAERFYRTVAQAWGIPEFKSAR